MSTESAEMAAGAVRGMGGVDPLQTVGYATPDTASTENATPCRVFGMGQGEGLEAPRLHPRYTNVPDHVLAARLSEDVIDLTPGERLELAAYVSAKGWADQLRP